MIIRNKTTNETFEVAEGTKYAVHAYEEVKEAVKTDSTKKDKKSEVADDKKVDKTSTK